MSEKQNFSGIIYIHENVFIKKKQDLGGKQKKVEIIKD